MGNVTDTGQSFTTKAIRANGGEVFERFELRRSESLT